MLTAAVTLWVGGFDVLYACQDFDHDRAAGLYSLPQSIGIPAAFLAARACTWPCWGCWSGSGCCFISQSVGWLGIAAVAMLLAYEHSLVSPRDLRRLNAAFFTMNGVIARCFWPSWPPTCGCGVDSHASESTSGATPKASQTNCRLWYGARVSRTRLGPSLHDAVMQKKKARNEDRHPGGARLVQPRGGNQTGRRRGHCSLLALR